MNAGELETVITYVLPVKVLVLNNFGDGMVKQWQKLFHKGRLSASDRSLHRKDFVKAAQADGFQDAGVYPMVAPGQSYDEMITGDFIPSRHKVRIKEPGPSEMF